MLHCFKTFFIMICFIAMLEEAFAADDTSLQKPLQIVTGNDFKPWTDETLPNGGFITDLITEIYHRMDVETEMIYLPWKRGYLTAAKGDYIGTFPYWATEERLKQFLFSKPLFKNKLRFFVRHDSKFLKEPLKSLNGQKFCLPTGYEILDSWAPFVTKSQRESVREMAHCFRLLHEKRVDFIPANEAQGWLAAKETNIDPTKFAMYPKIIEEAPLYYMISKKWKENPEQEIERFNLTFDDIVNDGTYEQLVKKHLSSLTTAYEPDISSIKAGAKSPKNKLEKQK